MNNEKIIELEKQYEDFKNRIATTEHEATRKAVDALSRMNPAFMYWALMKCELDDRNEHARNLSAKIWNLEDQINELLGKGHGVIQECDELLNAIKEYAPEWKSKLKWVVCIPEEPDSEPEYFPAENKEIAQRAVRRYHNMMKNRFADHPDLAESINSSIDCCIWHGTDAEFEALKCEFFFDEEWFKKPMYECCCAEQIQEAFRYKEIVHCFNGDKELITDSIEEAKRFYEVV